LGILGVASTTNSATWTVNLIGSDYIRDWVQGFIGVRGSSQVFARASEELDVVTRGADNSLAYHVYSGNAWQPPAPLAPPNSAFSTPSVFVRTTGESDVVVQGPNNSLNYYYYVPSNGKWLEAGVAAPNTTFSAPALFVRADSSRAVIVAQGANNSLWYYSALPGDTSWGAKRIAGPNTTFSAPAVFVRLDTGEVDVAALGASNSLMYYWGNPDTCWSDPCWNSTQVAGLQSSFSPPTLVVRASHRAELVVQGANNEIDEYYADPGGSWMPRPVAGAGSAFSAPSLFVRTNGESNIVVQGPNQSLSYYVQSSPDSGWGGPTVIAGNGSTLAAPSIFVRTVTTLRADVVAQGPSGFVDYSATPGAQWQPNAVR
jgi:hypothetical protein